MQRVVVFIIWTILALLVQTVILPDFPSARVWSDLLFYLVIILGLRFRLATGVILAALLGYIADTTSLAPYGTTLISYVLILLFIRQVKANIYLESRLSLFFWVAVFSLFKQLIQTGFLAVSVKGFDLGAFILWRLFLQSIWDALLGLLILPLIEKMMFADWALMFRRKGLRYK